MKVGDTGCRLLDLDCTVSGLYAKRGDGAHQPSSIGIRMLAGIVTERSVLDEWGNEISATGSFDDIEKREDVRMGKLSPGLCLSGRALRDLESQ